MKPTPKQPPQAKPEDSLLPPNDPRAEAGVLGCILMDSRECMDAVVERLPSKEFFYDTAHAIIYDAMLDLHSRQKPVEMIGLQSLLTKRECLEHAGGISYLMKLENDIPTIAALDFYLENVEVNAIRRRGVAIFTDLVRECFESSSELPDLLDSIERQAMALRTGRAAEIKPLPGVVDSVMRQIEDITQHKGIPDAIPTGFPGLDRQLTSGLCGSKMIIIAARPSEGKTAIAANIIEHVAIDCRIPVAFFSLEMDAEELVSRMVCSRSGVNFEDLTNGRLHPNAPLAMVRSSNDIRRAPIHIDDTGGLNVNQIKARARRMVQRHKVRLIVVDYLQLVAGAKNKKENRQQEVADISSALKGLAKELRIPVIVLAQLNREIEKDRGRCPRLSDLRESGSMEMDADVVIMLWPQPTDSVDPDGDEPSEIRVKLFIAKQRNGPRNRFVPLVFQRQFTRFVNPSKTTKIDESDIPL